MSDNRAIGIFDSGLGGLTVAKEIFSVLPNENIVYFGDTGRVPYGVRSTDTIRRYAKQDESFLLSKDVKLIIAACGTVSSVASDIGEKLPVPYFEVVSHSVNEALKLTMNKKIGIIGTDATIKSGKHKQLILNSMPDAQVFEKSCPMFVPLVEEGWYTTQDCIVSATVERYLFDIKKAGVDTLILGCTHYPILETAIRSYMGENVVLINAGTATALAVKEYLEKNDIENDGKLANQHRFFLSDKTDSFYKTADLLLGTSVDTRTVEQVDVSNL